MEEEYRLVISNYVTDLSGNQLKQDEEFYFTVANQFLQVTSIRLGEGEEKQDAGESQSSGDENPGDNGNEVSLAFQSGSLKEIAVNDEKSTVITTICFSQPLCLESLQNDIDSISMEPLFPITAECPILEQVSYDKKLGLVLYWSGFSPSSGDVENYYRLKIAGGVSGPKTDAGNYLLVSNSA